MLFLYCLHSINFKGFYSQFLNLLYCPSKPIGPIGLVCSIQTIEVGSGVEGGVIFIYFYIHMRTLLLFYSGYIPLLVPMDSI